MKRLFFPIVFLLLLVVGFSACKKCITCTARDTTTGDIKFEERSCAKGPLLDEWQEGIKYAYPPPGYNTECK